jgi:2Fe-2S ferredoxin
MPTLNVIDIYGHPHTIEAVPGGKLMEALRAYDFGVPGACGGYLSCATCHVYIDADWAARLPAMQSDEHDLVSMLATYRAGTSRLSCQIPVTAALDGLQLTVAPEE